MLRQTLAVLLALSCAGCTLLRLGGSSGHSDVEPLAPAVGEAPVSEPAVDELTEPAQPVREPEAPTNQASGGNEMTQTTQTRGQFELVGGQGRVINGFVRIPALVHNHSQEWADVVIDVELLDAAGQVLVNRAAVTAGEQMRGPYAIPPGGTMFYLYLRDVERLNGAYASHRLNLSQAYATDPTGAAEVTIASQTALKPAYDGAPAYLARGTAISAAGCAEPLVVAAGFDAQGHLLDVVESLLYPVPGLREFGTDLSELAPGATGHFTLEFLVPGIQSVQARCVCL